MPLPQQGHIQSGTPTRALARGEMWRCLLRYHRRGPRVPFSLLPLSAREGGREGGRAFSSHKSSSSHQLPIGFVGLGNMGSGMINNLASCGFSLRLFDADKVKTQSRVSAILEAGKGKIAAEYIQAAPSLEALSKECGTICVSLPNEGIGEKVFHSLLSTPPPSRLHTVIDHGTVSVGFTKRCYQRFAQQGITYLDAPVSGGPDGAAKRTLSIMVGGSREAFSCSLPILEGMGSLVIHMGPSGAGTAAKLINQLLTGVHIQAAAEAYALSKKLGISDTAALLHLLSKSWGNSTMLQRSGALLQQAEQQDTLREGGSERGSSSPSPFSSLSTSGAPLRNFLKDFSMIEEAGREGGLELPLTAETAAQFRRGKEEGGLEEWDVAAVVKVVRGFEGGKEEGRRGSQ
ncbi:hypothetical protein VYU27_007945 [Nannochloropsis oceanica]